MRIVLAFCLSALLSAAAFAQQTRSTTGSLVGRIEGIEPANAEVQITRQGDERTKFSTVADKDGNYRIENIPPGKYTVYATSTKISDIEDSATVRIEAGKTSVANLDIKPAPITEEVTVSIAAGQDQADEEVSKAVSVITGQEMRDRADITLADSLRTIPGLRVQQLGGFGRTASIKSRGLRNQDTAILIDGMRLRDASSTTGDATAFLSDLTLTSVSRVEVLRGPGSSLYGTNAIGGTVDLQTPAPPPGWHGQISGAAGGLGLGRFRGNVSNGTSDGKFGFNAALSRTIFTEGIDGDDEARNTNVQSRVDLNPWQLTNISAKFFFSDAFAALNSSPDTFGPLPASSASILNAVPGVNFVPDADDPDNSQRSRVFTGQLGLRQIVGRELLIQLSYQGLTTRRNNTNGPLGIRSQPFSRADETDLFRGRIHTLNGQLNWTPNGGHRTTAGYEFELENFGNDHLTINAPDNFSVRAAQSGHTVFAQQLLSFFDNRMQMSGAFRIQTFSLGRPHFTPVSNPTFRDLILANPPTAYTGDGSASYFFRSSGTKLRVHAGNGYRVPSLFERFGSFYSDQFGFSTSGNPLLKPERSTAIDAGIDHTLFADRLHLSATYYYTDIGEAIDFGFCVPQCLPAPDPLGRFSGYYNSEGRVARGVEASAEVKPWQSTSIFASYTFTNSDERNPLNLGVLRSPGIPVHTFTAVVTQRIGKRFWINADLAAASSYIFPFFNFNISTFESRYLMYRFKGNRRIDLTTGYKLPINKERFNVRFFLTVENILDEKYFENGFRTIGRTARVGLNFGF